MDQFVNKSAKECYRTNIVLILLKLKDLGLMTSFQVSANFNTLAVLVQNDN